MAQLSVKDYGIKFFKEAFYKGLKTSLKEKLLDEVHDYHDVEELAQKAIQKDQRIFAMNRREQSGNTQSDKKTSNPPPSRTKTKDPSDTKTPTTRGKKRKLSPDEYDRRKREGLCLYCGEKHMVKDCEKAKNAFATQRTGSGAAVTQSTDS